MLSTVHLVPPSVSTTLALRTLIPSVLTHRLVTCSNLALGLGAQYGAFGTSFGVNYTGSENTDSFGVNAQARYMF